MMYQIGKCLSMLVLLTVGLFGCVTQPQTPDRVIADTVFKQGRVYTVDAGHSWAEAVAIRDGNIIYVGTDRGVQRYLGTETLVVNLQGRLMLPAFQDIHIHPITAGIEASACDLNGLPGLADYQAAIETYARSHPDEPWILGGGWSMPVFGPGGAPGKQFIDQIVNDRPVYLTSADGHTGWANSRALELAGITRDTPDPVDGRIDRDPVSGEPIGSLQEGAMTLVQEHIPALSQATREQGLRYSQTLLNSYGITSIQDAIVGQADLETYHSLDQQNQLTLRVIAALWWDRTRGVDQIPELVAMRERYGSDGLVRPTSVKIMQDGVMENYTAAMLEPYLIPTHTRGIPMVEPELLKQVVTELDADGFQVHFHAIGDAAIRQSLDAVEAAVKTNGRSDHRHHISHLEVIDPADIPRFQQLDVVANFQPLWAYADEYITDLTIPYIGDARARWLYPIRSVQKSGGRIAFGSDWSVSTANPFPQIETAISRRGANDEPEPPLNAEEAIDLASAIDAFTINAAFVNHQEQQTGSIEVGKAADLIVLDQNLFEIPVADISKTTVLLTLFNGVAVHGSLAGL